MFFSLRRCFSLSKRGRVTLALIKFTNPSTELRLRLESLFHANVRQLSWNTSQRYVMISQWFNRAAFFASVSRRKTRALSRLSSALNFRIRIRGIRIAHLMTLCALYVNNRYLSRRASGRQFTMPTQKAT